MKRRPLPLGKVEIAGTAVILVLAYVAFALGVGAHRASYGEWRESRGGGGLGLDALDCLRFQIPAADAVSATEDRPPDAVPVAAEAPPTLPQPSTAPVPSAEPRRARATPASKEEGQRVQTIQV